MSSSPVILKGFTQTFEAKIIEFKAFVLVRFFFKPFVAKFSM